MVDDRILKVLEFLSAFNIRKLTSDPVHAFYILNKFSYMRKKLIEQAVTKGIPNYVGTGCGNIELFTSSKFSTISDQWQKSKTNVIHFVSKGCLS